MKRILVFIPVIFLLGCAPKVKYMTVYKTKTIYLKPGDSLINYKIDTPKPPNKDKFISADPITREKMLSLYIINLLKTIKEYKIKDKNLQEWYKKAVGKGN